MSRVRHRQLLAVLILLAQALAAGIQIVVRELGRQQGVFGDATLLFDILGAVSELTFAAVGLVIIARQPGNTIGWLFLLANLGWAVSNSAAAWVESSVLVAPLPGTPVAAWLATWPGTLSTMVYVLIALLFPNGHALTMRWRKFLQFVVIFGLVGGAMVAFGAGEIQSVLLEGVSVDNPFALPGVLGAVLGGLGNGPVQIGSLAVFVAAAASLVLRYRRSSGIERLQVKWLASAIALTALLWLSTMPVVFAYPDLSVAPAWARLWDAIVIDASMIIPIAAGIAILRYHLWDIDRIISRTLSYAIVSGLLAAVFAGLVLGLQDVLASVTGASTLAVAASTLAVFALFAPLRRRVQRVVDRRFNRSRYNAEHTVAELTARLRDETDLALVRGEVEAAIHQALAPSSTVVWMRSR